MRNAKRSKEIMETQTKTKKVPIPANVFRDLERRAKVEGYTTDEYAEKLLLLAIAKSIDHFPALCPYCEKRIWIPEVGQPITTEVFRRLAQESAREFR